MRKLENRQTFSYNLMPMKPFIHTFLIIGLLGVLIISCSSPQPQGLQPLQVDAENFEKDLQTLLITADSGSVIIMPEGNFDLSRSISMDGVPGLTLKGAGKDKTVLSFKGQVQGAEGLLMKGDNLTLEGFTVEDSKGDGIKIQDANGVILRDLNVTWTNGADSTNGGYGIYPVACTNLLMEKCEASYASDAGIYVGQCTNVIMRENYAHHNVAGIEIENSRQVDCYGNTSENNTGGILIFNLPDLPQAFGYNVRVYDNVCRNNNFQNFSPKGGMVNIIPPGSGITVVAHRDLEIFSNEITGHNTLGLGIVSYLFTQRPFSTENGFDPFYYHINVHDNTFSRVEGQVDQTTEYGQLISALFGGESQDILIDGIFTPGEEAKPPVCFANNGEGLRFSNLNAAQAQGAQDMMQSMNNDISPFQCTLPALDQVVL